MFYIILYNLFIFQSTCSRIESFIVHFFSTPKITMRSPRSMEFPPLVGAPQACQ